MDEKPKDEETDEEEVPGAWLLPIFSELMGIGPKDEEEEPDEAETKE